MKACEGEFLPERFVSAEEAAAFLGVNRRFLLALARKGIAGAYPLGTGDTRKTWCFRIAELSEAIASRSECDRRSKTHAIAVRSGSGSPR
jgi:hypothetical protein